jgi:hypothetical protein
MQYGNRKMFILTRYCSYCSKNDYKTVIDECVSGGRYCAPDPDSSGPLIGRDVVMEDLRQICIFEIV